MPDRIQIKEEAKQVLRGARVNPYLVSLIVVGVLGLLGGLDSYVGASQTVDQMAGYDPDLAAMLPSFPEFPVLLVAFVAAVNWLAQAILSAGWSIYHLGVRRGKEMPFACLLDGFNFLGKLILLNIVMSIFVFLWSLLFYIPGLIAQYRYRFAVYNLCENPDIGIMEAISMSKAQTAGFKWTLFVLDLSFIGWILLSGQQDPPDEGQVQHKQRPLEARRLGLAHADGLHDADVGIFAQVIHREAVPVLGDEAGDIEQQGPQEHEDAHNDVQKDQLPQEVESIQQAGEGHFLAPAHTQVIDGPAGAENCLGQPVHRRHKGHQQHRELRKAGQHRRQVRVIACHLVHGLGRPHIGVQPAQQAQNPHNDQ